MANLMLKGGSIINITSMYGKVSPNPSNYEDFESINPLLYGAMKAALIQATKYLSSILGPKSIRVNSVSYGPFPSTQVIEENPKFVNNLAINTHLKRVGNSKEATGVIEFLLSVI